MNSHKDYIVRKVFCECGNDTYIKTCTITGMRVWECGNCRKQTHRRRSPHHNQKLPRQAWNVRTHDIVGGRWMGIVYAQTEVEARLSALSQFNIPSNTDFSVSPR